MKLFLIFFLTFFSLSSWANELGLGLSLGNPTGLNGKYWLDQKSAFDGGLAMSVGKKNSLSMHSDYLFHQSSAFYFNDIYGLDLYYGFGGRMEFSDDIELGLRLPFGLAHRFEVSEADIFFEAAPILDFVSRAGLELHLLFGSRYYFGD
jgi:hypothetical protein